MSMIFISETCPPENSKEIPPFLCRAPICVLSIIMLSLSFFFPPRKVLRFSCYINIVLILLQYQYANYSNSDYKNMGPRSLKLQLFNQRSDFSSALFSSGLLIVCLQMFYLALVTLAMTKECSKP